jgi:hypothetical protein
MGALSTVSLTKDTAIDDLPKQIGNSFPADQHQYGQFVVVFVDESVTNFEPDLDYYRKLYTNAGYSQEMVDSLVEGLSESSLYEGKTP